MSRGPATPSPRLEIEKRDQKIAQLETDISALHADRKARRIQHLETENSTLNTQVAGLKDELALLQRKMDGLIDGFVGSDLLGRKNRVTTDQEPVDPKRPASPVPGRS